MTDHGEPVWDLPEPGDPRWLETAPEGLGSKRHPVVITGAQHTIRDEYHERVLKYTILMAFRIPCLFLAGWAYSAWQNPWISMAIVGVSIPLPWIAVLIANDGPPQNSRRRQRRAKQKIDLPPFKPNDSAPGYGFTIDG